MNRDLDNVASNAGAEAASDATTDPAGVRSRLSGPERKAQVLAVARHVLADQGYHGTTMSDIADAAGVTKPVLYQHYTSKRDLYAAVLDDIAARLREMVVTSVSAAPTPRSQAEAGIAAFARFVEQDYESFRLLFDTANRQDEEWAEITREVERSMAQALATLIDVPAIDERRRQVLAHGTIGLVESMMRYARTDQLASIDERLVADITALAWGGLRGLEP